MNTGNLPRLLQAGLKNTFDTTVKAYPDFTPEMFDVRKSVKKAYEVSAQVSELGLMKETSEGAPIQYDNMSQGFLPKFVHLKYCLGIEATEELIADEQYGVLQARAKYLGKSAVQTKNVLSAAVFNNGFDTAYTMLGTDGKPLFSATHVSGPNGGTYSNLAATPSDLTESTLEDLLIQMGGATNARGLKVPLMAKTLLVPTNYQFIAQRILKSDLQSGTANNAINALKSLNLKLVVNPYLTDVDAFFLLTDADEGLICYEREAVSFKEDTAFSTGSSRFKASFRQSLGWGDAHGAYGNAG